ncbi:MAG: hypothetical protein PVF91_15250 [Chromatiales bacterium]|jgi:hypothetical protein
MRIPATAALAFALTVPAVASGADYAFHVPVRLEQMARGVARAQVECEVYADETRSFPLGSGSAFQPVDFRSGGLQHTFTVRVNLRAEHRGQVPSHYACRLLLLAPWASPPWQAPARDAPDPAMRPAPDTEFRTVAEGELPRPPASGFLRPPGPP